MSLRESHIFWNDYDEIRTIWKVLFILFIIISVISIIIVLGDSYYENHPCLESKIYCYYYQSATGVGIGYSSNGAVPTVTTSSIPVYINCSDKDITPHEIYEQERCIRRE